MAESKYVLDQLLDKLQGWITQQPEWAQLMNAPRGVRRRIAREVARVLFTIPTWEPPPGYLSRGTRRKLEEQLRKEGRL